MHCGLESRFEVQELFSYTDSCTEIVLLRVSEIQNVAQSEGLHTEKKHCDLCLDTKYIERLEGRQGILAKRCQQEEGHDQELDCVHVLLWPVFSGCEWHEVLHSYENAS